ncbi:MAG: amidohydrolase family protein, partial [Kordiimonadaceae bacterium]|nr:amidohydrolase family protein [Kordiimonadaceae bacterium]
IVNIGVIVTGDWREPIGKGDTILTNGGLISRVGTATAAEVEACDVVIDAAGATIMPGLVDSQVHVVFGDYTPRQKTVGWLESYVHGGVTTSISASEVHLPGRPKDVDGVKALAVLAHKHWENYQPGGMRVHGGSIILEPGLTKADLQEIKDQGVKLAKAGFGAFDDPMDYVPLMQAAREVGLITNVHTGGASIPGALPVINGAHLKAMNPHVSFHINGGPVAMPDADFEPIIAETDIAAQVCIAGNIRTMLMTAELCWKYDAFDRFLIATDTPTGSGIMPLGMIYTITYLSALAGYDPAVCIGAATGNNADIYGLNCGYIREGRDADILIADQPMGGSQGDLLSSLKHGDIYGLGAVISGGIPRFVGKSRNTPPPTRPIRVVQNNLPRSFETVRF